MVLACVARASAGRGDYIQIRHAGEQDHPIFTLVLVTDRNALAESPPLTHYFVVSKTFFQSIAPQVADAQGKFSQPPKEPPLRGTLDITWRIGIGSGRYIVPSSESCSYQEGLRKTARSAGKDDKAARDFLRDLEQNGRYIGCEDRK
jgi:hypothetical protein